MLGSKDIVDKGAILLKAVSHKCCFRGWGLKYSTTLSFNESSKHPNINAFSIRVRKELNNAAQKGKSTPNNRDFFRFKIRINKSDVIVSSNKALGVLTAKRLEL